MAESSLRAVIARLGRMVGRQGGCSLTDAQLLSDFVQQRDQRSFEVLVWRHGAMVLHLCQRVLRDSHAAEDAFQAAFLIFARKAGSIGKRGSVGSWLYKVAYRVALRARAQTVRRQAGLYIVYYVLGRDIHTLMSVYAIPIADAIAPKGPSLTHLQT